MLITIRQIIMYLSNKFWMKPGIQLISFTNVDPNQIVVNAVYCYVVWLCELACIQDKIRIHDNPGLINIGVFETNQRENSMAQINYNP